MKVQEQNITVVNKITDRATKNTTKELAGMLNKAGTPSEVAPEDGQITMPLAEEFNLEVPIE